MVDTASTAYPEPKNPPQPSIELPVEALSKLNPLQRKAALEYLTSLDHQEEQREEQLRAIDCIRMILGGLNSSATTMLALFANPNELDLEQITALIMKASEAVENLKAGLIRFDGMRTAEKLAANVTKKALAQLAIPPKA